MRFLLAVGVFFVWSTSPAWAKKADVVQKLLADGKCAEVVTKVDEWEARGALGTEVEDLTRLRGDAAYCVARGADSVASWTAFLARFGDRADASLASARLHELAFVAAQAEGTPAAMKAFIRAYPDAAQIDGARKQEEAWAFDDASRSGDPRVIEAFLAEHPQSALRAQVWESLVQKHQGIYLISPSGEPRRLDPVAVAGDQVVLPPGLPSSGAWPVVGVNLPGAGRGETSEWWSLKAVVYDEEGVARLTDVAPLGVEVAARLGITPPGREAELLRMVPAAGTHVARVATSRAPLAVPGHCPGSRRYALVLETPGQGVQAFPFGVDCPDAEERTSAVGLLFGLLDAADGGDRVAARQKWGALVGQVEGEALRGWLAAGVSGDPWTAMVDARPAVGDWVVWTTQPDGSILSSWLRLDDQGARALAVRPGWSVIANGALRTTIGEPACERMFGSLGATLFCVGEGPHLFNFEGTPLSVGEPPPEALAAVGLAATLPAGAIVAAGPRWQGHRLVATWRVRTGVQVDVVAPAPAAWTETAPVPAVLGRWLEAQAGSGPLGLSVVQGNAGSLYRSFTGG